MFLFKYGRFIHDSIGFDGCLLDLETKLKGRENWLFFQDFRQPIVQPSNQLAWANQVSSGLSNQLAWASYNLLGRVSTFSIKQSARLGECISPGRVGLATSYLFL